jgi:hypothetical protein
MSVMFAPLGKQWILIAIAGLHVHLEGIFYSYFAILLDWGYVLF